jgi:cytidylate kinase
MARRVICISRTLGAGGDEVAQRVASALAFRYVDDEIVARAAEEAGVSKDEIAKAEHSQPLVARIVEALAAVPAVSEGGFVAVPPVISPKIAYSHLIEHVIRETTETGDVVIVAHGASHPLAGRADVLRVLVTASPDVRTKRLAAQDGLGEGAAKKALEASDREREKYLERFYNVRHELPTQYDLTLNTDTIGVGTAVELIVAAAQASSRV